MTFVNKAILWNEYTVGSYGFDKTLRVHNSLYTHQTSVQTPAIDDLEIFNFNLFKIKQMPSNLTFWSPNSRSNLFWMRASLPIKVSLMLAVIFEGRIFKEHTNVESKHLSNYLSNYELGAKTFNYQWAVLYIANSSLNSVNGVLKELKSKMAFSLFEYDISQVSQFPADLLNYIKMIEPENKLIETSSPKHFIVPKLPQTRVKLDEIGIADTVSLRFAKSVITGLVDTDTEFSIWIDASKKSVTFDGNTIASYQTQSTNQDFVFHVSLEVEGFMYDSYKGFNGDIAVEDFQKRIKGDERYQITVPSSLRDIDEIEKQIDDLIKSL